MKHDYILDGTKILRESWNYDEATKTYQDILIPLYDNEDSVCGIIYNNVPYYFLKNLQGDVIAITNENGGVISRYSYDAWGANTGIITCAEPTDSVDIANINPFRYIGYFSGCGRRTRFTFSSGNGRKLWLRSIQPSRATVHRTVAFRSVRVPLPFTQIKRTATFR